MLLNCDKLHPGETLSKLKEDTKGFDPEVDELLKYVDSRQIKDVALGTMKQLFPILLSCL